MPFTTEAAEPTDEDFRALARSSPRAWSSLRFLLSLGQTPVIRAWIARPDRLRVEDPLGSFLGFGQPRGIHERGTDPATGLPFDDIPWRPDDTVPLYLHAHGYRWVAMLEPLELAASFLDPEELPEGLPEDTPPVRVHAVERRRHHGRPTLAATVSTTATYDPRCPCCPLLASPDSARLAAAGGLPVVELSELASRFLVLLDEQTGVCVGVTELDGPTPGSEFDIAIEEVDEPYDGALFTSRGARRG